MRHGPLCGWDHPNQGRGDCGGIAVRQTGNSRSGSGLQSDNLHTAAALSKTFKRIGYDLDVIKASGIAVPRLFLARLPPDMSAIRQIKERKAIF